MLKSLVFLSRQKCVSKCNIAILISFLFFFFYLSRKILRMRESLCVGVLKEVINDKIDDKRNKFEGRSKIVIITWIID